MMLGKTNRRRGLTTAIGVAICGGLVLAGLAPVPARAAPTPSAARLDSVQGGSVTRSETLARAQNWVDRGITYTQNGPPATDADGGHAYRRDCSGLVSMAWHYGTSLVTNQFLDKAWNNDGMHVVSLDDLQPGDAVVRDNDGFGIDGHMELFAFWKDTNNHGQGAYVYSFNNDGETVQNPYADTNSGNRGFDSWSELTTYTAIRYNGISGHSSLSGDERAELLLLAGDGFRIFPNVDGQVGGWPWGMEYRAGAGWTGVNPDRVHFADLDGDGLSDLIVQDGDHFRAWPNLYGGTAGAFPWGSEFATGAGWSAIDPRAVFFADITGDGRADLIYQGGDTVTAFANVNNGHDWTSGYTVGTGWTGINPDRVYFA